MVLYLNPLHPLQCLLLLLCTINSSFSFQLVSRQNNNERRPSVLLFSRRTESPTYPQVNLTIVIPAYNEVDRIGDTLQSYLTYLKAIDLPPLELCRVLVVDDGSQDETANFVHSFPNVECHSLPTNLGKGAAVSYGISQLTAGDLCLVADADGSASIQDLPIMLARLVQTLESSLHQQHRLGGEPTQKTLTNSTFWTTPAVVVGCRITPPLNINSTTENVTFPTTFVRSILRWGFRTTVRCLAGDLSVQDSQCGFKLMTVTAAQFLYHDLQLQRWTHDVEVLYRAKHNQIAVAEQDIDWQDKDGSKLVNSPGGTIGVSFAMLVEVLKMRVSYDTGWWTMPRLDYGGKKEIR